MRYRLRTLLIVLAIFPPLIWIGWTKYEAWQAEQARRAARVRLGSMPIALDFAFPTTPTTPQAMDRPLPAESEQEFSFFFGITR
jgi:hypothetical protein